MPAIVAAGASPVAASVQPDAMPQNSAQRIGTDANSVPELRAARCTVLRVSRLGKSIASRFAYRYYDAVAPGLNFWDEAQLQAGEWTKGYCFDYSLCVGTFKDPSHGIVHPEQLVMPIAEAIEAISNLMTIRQGDYIFIDYKGDILKPEKNQIIEEEGLYCKIK